MIQSTGVVRARKPDVDGALKGCFHVESKRFMIAVPWCSMITQPRCSSIERAIRNTRHATTHHVEIVGFRMMHHLHTTTIAIIVPMAA